MLDSTEKKASTRKVAVEFGFVGLGGAGGKIVEAFRYLGKYQVLALNTSSQDLSKLKMDDDNDKVHLDIGSEGAGKDMTIGAAAIKKFSGDVHQAISRKFHKDQYLMVCAGGGGGTGCGGITALIDACLEHTEHVGVFFTLPKDTEGEKVRHNTAETLAALYQLASEKKISPLVLVDNDKVADMHKDWNIITFWKQANSEITNLFHQINLVCAQDSEVHAFDPADYKAIMKSGRCLVFGSLDIPTEDVNTNSISNYMRDNLNSGLLAKGFDDHYSESKVAGAILLGNEDSLSNIPMEYLEMAFGVLNRVIGDGTVHRGIYVNDKIPLRVYTLIGNLPLPSSRVKNLNRGK
jgi:cell division GTPase FtsZ